MTQMQTLNHKLGEDGWGKKKVPEPSTTQPKLIKEKLINETLQK